MRTFEGALLPDTWWQTVCQDRDLWTLLEPEFVAQHRVNPSNHQQALDDWREGALLPLEDLFGEE